MPGELEGDRVVIREQSEANRIYNKGGHGRPLSGGGLELDLVEASYLVAAGRLKLAPPFDAPEAFLSEAARQRPEFAVQSLAYRELRDQKPELRLSPPSLRKDGIDFRAEGKGSSKRVYVRALSERAPVPLRDLFEFAARCETDGAHGLIAIVDEESEITQYAVSNADPRGKRPVVGDLEAQDALLLGDRLFLAQTPTSRVLHDREFLGKPAPGGYYLSLVEAVHLSHRGVVRVAEAAKSRRLKPDEVRRRAKAVEPGLDLRSAVYEDLKARDLVVKTGYKFGTHFRAYEDDPTATHAPFLVESTRPEATFEWPHLSRAIRLAHGVRKRLLLAEVGAKAVRYLGIERVK